MVEVRKWKTLSQFIADCRVNDIYIAKIRSRWLSAPVRRTIEYSLYVKVTACSKKSPILRVFETRKIFPDDVVSRLEIEGINVDEQG